MNSKKGPIRALVVENEADFGWLCAHALETLEGMETLLVQDGVEGLRQAWEWRPDVILLDLTLPLMSGVELLRCYRQEGGRARVLALCNVPDGEVKAMAYALGADYVLGRPFRWSEVFHLVHMMLGGLEEQCRTLLRRMGARERSKGFGQAARCAALLGERRCELLKEAYVEVAAGQRTGPDCVAKNIERLAKDLHEEYTDFYRKHTGRRRRDPPMTNREFLDLLSQAARIPL